MARRPKKAKRGVEELTCPFFRQIAMCWAVCRRVRGNGNAAATIGEVNGRYRTRRSASTGKLAQGPGPIVPKWGYRVGENPGRGSMAAGCPSSKVKTGTCPNLQS